MARLRHDPRGSETMTVSLRPGMKLYRVIYWSISGRKMDQITIKKIHRVTVQAAWYSNLRVRIEDIDTDGDTRDAWFTTRERAIMNTLRLSRNALEYRMIYSVDTRERRAMEIEIR